MMYFPYPLKRCKDCGETLPESALFFQSGKRFKNGIRPRCRPCYLLKHAKDMENWRDANPERMKQYQRDYRIKNPDKVRGMDRARYKRDAMKRISWQRWFRRAHPEKTSAARKSYHTFEGRCIHRAGIARRRAKQRQLPAHYTGKDWQSCLEYWGGCCAVCGRPQGLWHTIAQDHWIPVSDPQCPGTVPTNIVPLCHGIGGCNNSKGGLHPRVWLISAFGSRKAKQILEKIEKYFHSITSNPQNG